MTFRFSSTTLTYQTVSRTHPNIQTPEISSLTFNSDRIKKKTNGRDFDLLDAAILLQLNNTVLYTTREIVWVFFYHIMKTLINCVAIMRHFCGRTIRLSGD